MLVNITYETKQIRQNNRVSMRLHPSNIPVEFYVNLARNIIRQAVMDAAGVGALTKNDQAEAQDWLTSADCLWYCEVTGIDARAIRRWVNSGCPYDRQEVNKVRRSNRLQQPDILDSED